MDVNPVLILNSAMNKTLQITILDDDRNYLQIISLALEDFSINTFSRPEDALPSLRVNPPDAIILDLHLEETTGFKVYRDIRDFNTDVPIFLLSSDTNIQNISQSFELGFIDYLSKSAPIEETKTRITQRVLSIQKNLKPQIELTAGNLSMDIIGRAVNVEGKLLQLSPKEFDLLKIFLEKQNELITKEQLLKTIWKGTNVEATNIDTHMFHLRKKMQHCTYPIQTLKSLGYILRT